MIPYPKYNQEAAEGVAVQALSFLSEDDERFRRFLDLSGLDPSEIRAAAAQPGFLAGVLDHVAQDERLLIGFAQQSGLAPEEIVRAHSVLSGGGHAERDT